MKRLFLILLTLSCIEGMAQTTVGLNAGVLPFKNISLTFEHTGARFGIRPFVTCPFPGGRDRLGGGIDLRIYTQNINPRFRFYAGISPAVFRTDKYKTPYEQTGSSVKTIYNGFLCAGINLYFESFSIGIGGAGGAGIWKTSGEWYAWLSGRPEIIIAIRL